MMAITGNNYANEPRSAGRSHQNVGGRSYLRQGNNEMLVMNAAMGSGLDQIENHSSYYNGFNGV